MTGKLQRLIHRARALESSLGTAFESRAKAIVATPVPTQPFELVDLVVDELARHVRPSGRGRYTFLFNDVRVTFVAPTAAIQAHFDAICTGPPSIDERVVRRLVSAGCEMTSADLDVTLAFTDAPDPAWTQPFGLELARVDRSARTVAPAPTPAPPRLDLQITLGTAVQGAYSFTSFPIAIGRGAEIRDSRNQLLRINHVVFVESDDDVSRSVSRRHARIEIDPRSQQLRLIDDTSAQGTSIIRQGRIIRVPQGTRGLAVQDGDEMVFGQARVRVRLT
jgi:hypothetical protein